MPIYEYRCAKCGHEIEVLQGLHDDPKTVCPECNESSLEKQISGGIKARFKGRGFYENDYKHKR